MLGDPRSLLHPCVLHVCRSAPIRAHDSPLQARTKLVQLRARLPTTRPIRWERFQVISFFDPDPHSPTSYLHSAENPHLPTLVLAVCLQDSAMVTSACALRTLEPEPAAGQARYRHRWSPPARVKSPQFAPFCSDTHLRGPALVLPAREWVGPIPSRAVRILERAHAAC
jgi:hypothetical protein